ncbi:MAG: type IV pilus twitching motility protein PilT [Candidatus Brocadiaceae bacterium]|nr:type IV pilus twitching motility protein PilT [Candidatus Brocadiaceae bacterium]
MAQVDKFLSFLVKNSGSDLHLVTGSPPIVRIDGKLQKMKLPPLTGEQVKSLIYEIIPERNRKEYEAINDTDFAYEIAGVARFRTNVYMDLNGPSMAQRLIPFDIMTVDDLGISPEIRDLMMLPKGIVLCTGPTGCGKSTTLAALLHYANERRHDHVITIEDPVEFVHSNVNCIFSHRQVGLHTESFKRALRAAFREDPDIILVGEMRDLETTALAITAAETGHLVLATVHTTTASSTVDRVIDQFPPDRQAQIRVMLSSTLKAVITQALCRRKVKGRIAAFEILVVHSAVQNLIREKKTYQLPSTIQTGRKYGMCTMNESLMQLVEDGFIDLEESFSKSVDKQDMNDRVNNYLLALVQQGQIAPVEAVKQSYFRPNMIELLRAHGHGKSLRDVDLAHLDLADEQII